ncbi:hypothetical protein DV872_24065 [Oceanispirochaeta sp. M1]|nr:hypothetical protein DV872_24065 [Oceanispirochaeta sp. M1]
MKRVSPVHKAGGIVPRIVCLAERVGERVEASFTWLLSGGLHRTGSCKVVTFIDAPLPSPVGGASGSTRLKELLAIGDGFPAETGLRVLLRRPLRPGDCLFFSFLNFTGWGCFLGCR